MLCFRQQSIGYTLHMLWIALILHACVGLDSINSTPVCAKLPTKVIIVLNGLWQDVDTCDAIIQNLSASFAAEGLEIHTYKVMKVQTSERSIADQANYAFLEIQQYYSGPGYEIILVGHSQGGLRGAKVLALNQEANNPLNIKGLITLAAPWEGTHAATITSDRVKQLLGETSIKNLLKIAETITKIDLISLIGDMQKHFLNPAYYPTDQPGVQDMNPGNRTRSFLKDIKKSLEDIHLPVLAIAGCYKGKVTKLLPSPTVDSNSEENVISSCARMIEKFPPSFVNKTYASFFIGSPEHDMIVPVGSQLAKGFTNKHIEKHIIQGAIHADLQGFIIPKDQVIYNHPEAIKLMVNFIKERFSFSPSTASM